MEWISVEERLPDHGERVICAYQFGVGELRFGGHTGLFYGTCDGGMFEIDYPFTTHWMPLPEPPKGE